MVKMETWSSLEVRIQGFLQLIIAIRYYRVLVGYIIRSNPIWNWLNTTHYPN